MPKLKKTLAPEQPPMITPVQTLELSADIMPCETFAWKHLLPKLHRISQTYGFERVETSPIESLDFFQPHAELMPVASDRFIRLEGGKKMGLRPHNFLGVLRAYMDHHIADQERVTKWYYIEPAFSLDKTQPFHSYEYGVVVFGEGGAVSESQTIMMLKQLLEDLGFPSVIFETNSRGCENCAPYYEEVLQRFLQENKYELCASCQQQVRRESKPVAASLTMYQVFSCRNERCQEALQAAPQIIDYLDAACNRQLTSLLETLDELEVPYQLNPRLFGGAHFSHTIFRVKVLPSSVDPTEEVDLGIGGRQNRFLSRVAGRPLSGLSFSLPLQSLIELMEKHSLHPKHERNTDVFLINLGDLASKKSLRLFQDLLRNDITVSEHFGENGIKNQFKLAEKRNCRLALVIGQKEALEGNVILRDVHSGIQEVFSYDRIIEEVNKRLQD